MIEGGRPLHLADANHDLLDQYRDGSLDLPDSVGIFGYRFEVGETRKP